MAASRSRSMVVLLLVSFLAGCLGEEAATQADIGRPREETVHPTDSVCAGVETPPCAGTFLLLDLGQATRVI